MLGRLNTALLVRTEVELLGLALGLLLLVAGVDYATGFELALSIFYLAPIALAAWYLGQRAGLLTCAIAAALWFAADNGSGHIYSNPAFPYWNTLVRLGFFVITTLLLVRLRLALQAQQNLAERDPLTGLLNARTFKQYCHLAQLASARSSQSFCVAYMDIDGFKGINDSLGHSTGDELLWSIGNALTTSVRETDLVARMGGDEFAVLAPATDYAAAEVVFAKVHQRLKQLASNKGWPIGFSVGVVVFEAAPASPDAAIRDADRLMYRVKHGLKNSLLIERSGMPPEAGVQSA